MNLELLKESIRINERLKTKVYKCPAGFLSIGYGRNLEQNGITKNEAEILLENDLLNLKMQLIDKLPLFKKLNDMRQNVLLEMAYNMGLSNLLKFKNTFYLLSLAIKNEKNQELQLSNEYYLKASQEMLKSKWHEDLIKYDLKDGKRGNSGLLRSEVLSNIIRKGF